MIIISVAIQKGGSCKTTTAINMAAALQRMGKSVLLIDLDPQANLTQALGIMDDVTTSIYHVLKQEAGGQSADLNSAISKRHGLSVVPSSIELASAELELVSVYGREQVLSWLLKKYPDSWDFILIDCPPAVGMLTVNALVASDYVLIPMQAEFLPLRGLKSFLNHYETIRKILNRRLTILGIVLTKYDARKTMNRQVRQQLEEEFGDKLCQTYIRTNQAIVNAQKQGLDIFTFDETANGAVDYNALTKELLNRLGK